MSGIFAFFPVQVWASSACAALSSGETAKWTAVSKFVSVILAPLNSAQSTIATTANTMASSASSVGLAVAGLLAVTYLLWSIVDSFAGSGESIMSIMVEVLVPAAITAAAIGSYSSLVSTSGGLQGVITAFTQAATGSTSVSSAMASYMETLADTLGNAFSTLLSELGCTSITSFTLALVGEMLLSILIVFLATALSVIALGELVGVLLTGIVMVGIAIAVGPLFVACAVCKWSRGWFDSWLKFLLGASAYQMVASIVLSLVSGMVTSIQSQIQTTNPSTSNSSAGVSIAGLLGLLGLTWVMGHLFREIPQIAAGLFGGGAVKAPDRLFGGQPGGGKKGGGKGGGKGDKDGGKDGGKDGDKGGGKGEGGGSGGGGGGGGGGGPSVSSQTGSFSGG